jgi:hypothetical protein
MPIRVPRYERRVGEQGIPTVNTGGSVGSGGVDLGRGIASFGQSIAQIGAASQQQDIENREAERQRRIAEETQIMEADAIANDAELAITENVKSLTPEQVGLTRRRTATQTMSLAEASLRGPEVFQARLNAPVDRPRADYVAGTEDTDPVDPISSAIGNYRTILEHTLKGIKSPAAQVRFRSVINDRLAKFEQMANAHYVAQSKVAADNAMASVAARRAQSSVASAVDGDVASAMNHIEFGKQAIIARHETQGLDPTVAVIAYDNKAIPDVVDALASNGFLNEADAVLRGNSKKIDQQTAARSRFALDKRIDEAVSTGLANEAANQPTPAQATEWLDKQLQFMGRDITAQQRAAALDKTTGAIADRRRADIQADRPVVNALLLDLQEGNFFSEADPRIVGLRLDENRERLLRALNRERRIRSGKIKGTTQKQIDDAGVHWFQSRPMDEWLGLELLGVPELEGVSSDGFNRIIALRERLREKQAKAAQLTAAEFSKLAKDRVAAMRLPRVERDRLFNAANKAFIEFEGVHGRAPMLRDAGPILDEAGLAVKKRGLGLLDRIERLIGLSPDDQEALIEGNRAQQTRQTAPAKIKVRRAPNAEVTQIDARNAAGEENWPKYKAKYPEAVLVSE